MKKFVVFGMSLLLCAMAASAEAQSVCSAAKIKASGKKAAAKANCYSKAFVTGLAVDSGCLAKAEEKHAAAYSKAETRGDCLSTGDEVDVEAAVDLCVAEVFALLGPPSPARSLCSAAKIKASGKKTASKANCHSKAFKTGAVVDAACLTKAEEKHAAAYSKAETKGDCFSSGDEATAEAAVDTCVAVLAALLGVPSCTDDVENGTETDVDCGGSCPVCTTGEGCAVPADCDSGVCSAGICQAPSCSDGVENATETDVDCGGACPGCATGDHCAVPADCENSICTADICQAPSCSDGIENGIETDVDCGGSCPACEPPFTFSGVQNGLPLASLTGWSLCYSDLYNSNSASLASIQAACSDTNLLLACRVSGSGSLLVAAHAPRTDVFFDTGFGNTPHNANGVGWYFNGNSSWGFARQGDALNRDSCDYGGGTGSDTNAGERLCWHTSSGNLTQGWRCGANESLVTSDYERMVFQAP